MKKILVIIVLTGICGQLQAEPQFAIQYKAKYGYMPSCNACHKDGGGSPVNAYGKAFDRAGKQLTSFSVIKDMDSDGDGYANESETRGESNPGDSQSTPGNPGNWLDTENLIPEEIQAAFSDVKTYKPLDAIFTSEEIDYVYDEYGLRLTLADENTIYIPVKDNKAIGTGIIVPAEFEGKPFFLMVATDDKLRITHAGPVNTNNVPEAANAGLYSEYIGQPVNAVQVDIEGKPLQRAVGYGVEKAAIIIYVRLKGI